MSSRFTRFLVSPSVVLALAAMVVSASAGPAWAQFNPLRQFPDTSDGIYVFVDQLPNLTVAQRLFAATHYVGTQKQTAGLIDAIRVYNPDFIMIQYRLGVRESGHSGNYIHHNTWSNDWPNIDAHNEWFIPHWDTNPDPRVYQLYDGWLKEYCMDLSGEIVGGTGTPTAYGWKEYWVDCVIHDIDDSHGDGVFADSTHPPYAVPSDQYDSPIGSPPHKAYIYHLEKYYDYVYEQFTLANKYFIPNVGHLFNTADTTNGYYEDVHGAMVEGFATNWTEYDWRLQQNRTLRLLRNGKIYIAQNGPSGPTDISGRLWYMSNFLLLKHDRSYVNMLGAGTQMHWWPEYDLALGEQLDPSIADDVIELREPVSGIYYRWYEHGLVLVNCNGVTRNFALDGDYDFRLVTPWGGGAVGTGGTPAAGGLNLANVTGSLQMDPWSGAILLARLLGDANEDGMVDGLDYVAWSNSYDQTGGWGEADFDYSTVVDGLDYVIWSNHYGNAMTPGLALVPEPAGLAMLGLGALALLRRRRRP